MTNKGYEKIQEDTVVKIDVPFARYISNIKVDPNDVFSAAIGRALRGKLTQAEIAICDGVVVKPEKWYVKVWNWIKGLFVKPKPTSGFGDYPQAINASPSHRGVEINRSFDFQKWLLEKNSTIIKAIKEDGQEENIITCPIRYEQREYYIADNGHIHSSCEQGCRISVTQ